MINNISGKLLVSLPNIKQGVFSKSVIFIQGYDEDGSIGFMLNKKYPTTKSQYVASQLGLPDAKKIFFGGPVNTHTGFVLHSREYFNSDTVQLYDDVLFTPGKQIISDIKDGVGPEEYMIILGHSSWQPGQLEAEMSGQMPYTGPHWVTAEPDMDYFYGKLDAIGCWDRAIRQTASERSTFLLDND